jgi:starch synthase
VSDLEVLAVASEVYPLVKTGGLADVAGALPAALKPCGVQVTTVVPGYPAVLAGLEQSDRALDLPAWYGADARLLSGVRDGLRLLVLDAPHLYRRDGNPYVDAAGQPWGDNGLRFAALARLAASLGQGVLPGYAPRVIHTHDWQAGLTAAFLHFSGGPRPGVVATIHNLAFQGQFDRGLLASLGLPPQAFSVDAVEYYGAIGFLKAAVRMADRVTTVSPTYAAEIQTPEGGMGMDGLLRGRADRLSGIANGIDTSVWDPAQDPYIAMPYDAHRIGARAANKAALQQRLQLTPTPDAPLFGVVSRLSWQKGLDVLLAALPALVGEGAQLALLGSGDADLEAGFAEARRRHPGQVGCAFTYDEGLAHLIQAGADALLVPSRFEPCGLTQLCAMRYGAVPVVARVGGLADTVVDATAEALAGGVATGLQFAPVTTPALEAAIGRAVAAFRQPELWAGLQRAGMATDVSWAQPARRYAQLFRELVAERDG